MNCLNQAISEERIHQVRLLLSMDVDSEMKDKNDFDRTPLIKACLVKHNEPSFRLLKILLKFDVSINAVDALGRSALHYACESGKADVAKVLINEDGIELNSQDNEGRTPLMLACANGHLTIARMLMGKLVKFDLEIDLRDAQGYTALLLAIKYEHYEVAHDLVRYANSCITLRDNEKFMNAGEWLKNNLEERRKAVHGEQQNEQSRGSRQGRKSPSKLEKEQFANEKHGNLPTLTITEIKQESDEQEYSGSEAPPIADFPDSAKSAAMSSLLFESDSFRSLMRPPSTGRSLVSSTRPPSSSHDSTARPLTGASIASSTARYSASSRARQLHKLEQLREEGSPTQPHTTPLINPIESSLKRDTAVESTVSFATSRGSRKSWKLDDLESIIEDPHSGQPSRTGVIDSRSQSRLALKTPASTRSKSPFHQNGGRRSRTDLLNEEKSAEIYAIQKLKQALRDKSRRKITRASTAVFRPASGIPSEQWMSSIIKGTKRNPANIKSDSQQKSGKTAESPRSRKQSILSVNADTNSITSGNGSRKPSAGQFTEQSLAMRLLHASSNLSLDTLISESDVTETTNYARRSSKHKKSKNYNQLDTIFRLYTDSCLWKPPTKKPPSTSVQQINSDSSDKLTLQSEVSDELGNIVDIEGTGGSIPQKTRPVESKFGPRYRNISSATSRISKTRSNAGSAGGRSIASRHAD